MFGDLLSKIFGPKQADTPGKPDVIFYEKVVERIAVTEAVKTDVKRKVNQAFENPRSFYGPDNCFLLSERGLTYPKDALLTPKFVLIDTLLDANQMAEIDWKEAEEEIREELNKQLKAKSYNCALSTADHFDDITDTLEILNLINRKELLPLGYAVTMLDIDSDSYVFTVVPASQHQEVATLLAQLK